VPRLRSSWSSSPPRPKHRSSERRPARAPLGARRGRPPGAGAVCARAPAVGLGVPRVGGAGTAHPRRARAVGGPSVLARTGVRRRVRLGGSGLAGAGDGALLRPGSPARRPGRNGVRDRVLGERLRALRRGHRGAAARRTLAGDPSRRARAVGRDRAAARSLPRAAVGLARLLAARPYRADSSGRAHRRVRRLVCRRLRQRRDRRGARAGGRARLAARAARQRADLLFGAPRSEAGHTYNSVRLITAAGRNGGYYDKQRLVLGAEANPLAAATDAPSESARQFSAGSGPGVLQSFVPLGVSICHEVLFPELSARAVGAGAALLVNVSNDGWLDGGSGVASRQHFAMAAFRAVETRRYLVRAATTGVSGVIDPYGRVVASLGPGEAGVVTASAAGRSALTPYARVVASVGLAHWSGTRVPGLYQSEVVAVDGRPVRSAAVVYARVRELPPGTPVGYLLRRSGAEREVRIETQVFTLRDWLLLFGAFLVSGGTYFVLGLVVWVLRPGAPLVHALLAVGMAWGIFLISAMDLYGPATFFRLHVLCEALVPPAVLHLALLFPQPYRFARWRLAGYAPALMI